MALRIRKNGQILCAAIHPEKPGDTYINDELHYQMSVIHKIIGTQSWDGGHSKNGEWWWINNIPPGIEIDNFYLENNPKPEIKEEEEIELKTCEQCNENAWDGYICHNCGLKNI